MAQKVLVQLVDDLDGTTSVDVSTVKFNLDGVTYEIDLTDDNANQLRDLLATYVAAGRRIGGRVSRNTRPGNTSHQDAAAVREWAIAEGLEIAGRGRIPSGVVQAYTEAQAELAAQASASVRAKRTRAGGAATKQSGRPAKTTSKTSAKTATKTAVGPAGKTATKTTNVKSPKVTVFSSK